jgi:hypothetical protein
LQITALFLEGESFYAKNESTRSVRQVHNQTPDYAVHVRRKQQNAREYFSANTCNFAEILTPVAIKRKAVRPLTLYTSEGARSFG